MPRADRDAAVADEIGDPDLLAGDPDQRSLTGRRAHTDGRMSSEWRGPGQRAGARAPGSSGASWAIRRLFPLIATAGLILIGMIVTTVVEPRLFGGTAWTLPDDLWGTLVAARRLVHLNLGGLYTQPTGLVTFPGGAVILAPIAAVGDAAGLSFTPQGAGNPQPALWLVAGPYMIATSCVALFAADALAERLRVSRPKRALLMLASTAVLWSVSVEWGHPEDAVAMGLVLYAILALSEGRPARCAWLAGLAVAVQPLVLLVLPIMVAVVEPRRLAGFLARIAAPGAMLLGAAAAANWSATYRAVTSQPNWPSIDHPTPWTPLAPHLAGGTVAGGPSRAIAILLACGCAVVVRTRLSGARGTSRWSEAVLRDFLWWAAVCLALRSVFEPVMVAYYLWPALAVALIAAAWSWRGLLPTAALAVAVSFGAQSGWRSAWGWWGLMLAGLALTLFFARARGRTLRLPRAPGALPVPPGLS